MPYALKPNKLFVKDPNGDGYLPQNVVTDGTTTQQVAQIVAAGDTQKSDISTAGAAQVSALEARAAELEADWPETYTELTDEVSGLKSASNKSYSDAALLGCGDLMANSIVSLPIELRGVKISQVGDKFNIKGETSTNSSLQIIAGSDSTLPVGMVSGGTYRALISYDTNSPKSIIRLGYYIGSSLTTIGNYTADTTFTLPQTATGFMVRVFVASGQSSVNENVTIRIIGTKTNAELATAIAAEATARDDADDALDARVTALEDKTVAITPNILFTYPLGWRKGKYNATGSFSSNADDASTCLPVPVIPGSEKLKVTPPDGYAVSVTAFTAIPSTVSGNATWNASILIGQTAGAEDEALTIDVTPGHLYYITTTYPYADILTEQPVTIECINPGTGNAGPYDMNVIPILGQSLSLATTHATPAIHTQPVRGGYMLDTGVYQVGNTMGNMHGIVQLVEGSDSWLHDSSTGDVKENIENSAWGCAEAVSLLMGRNAEGHKQLYFTAGESGKTITDQFDSEMTVTARVFASVRKYSQYSNIGCPTIIWMHGEADSHSMTVQEYKDYLVSGIDIIRKLAMAIFGQDANVKCIAYQTARHQHTDHVSSDAQYELMRDDDNFAVSCPAFVSIFGPNDQTHSSNWGQYLMGRYHGIQLHDWIINGHKNVGVMPMKNGVTWADNTIKIKFLCERPPLRFVTSWVTERTDKGFDVVRMSGDTETALTITDIEVTAWNEVTITTSETLQAGDIVYYGMQAYVGDHATGNGGNLCDSQGEDLTATIDSTTVALNNYCLAFTETLA